ncbi:MAG: hypothetical protein DRI77_12880 [Chloroflexi bacterium]|nr:MAG: hypothetical protein DRI77_12880 [Chloroflexota bacterium]
MNNPTTITDVLLSDEGSHIQDAMETVQLADGEVLFRRGDIGDAFYVIDTGQIRIFTLDEEGRELTLNILGAGEAFGELALVDKSPRSASASAVGPTTPRRLRQQYFLAGVHTSPQLSEIVTRLLSQRTRHMTDYIEWLGQWARLVAEGKYDQAMKGIQDADTSDRALTAVADAVETMVKAVREREERLKKEVAQLRIQIDEKKRKKQVEEITETDYFQQLTRRARDLRQSARDNG